MLTRRDADAIFLERVSDYSVPQFIIWSRRLLNRLLKSDALGPN